jgi:hypothetical protein
MKYIIGSHEKVGAGKIATYRKAVTGCGWEVNGCLPEGARVLLGRNLPRIQGIGMRMKEVLVTTGDSIGVEYFSTKIVSPDGELLGLFKSPSDAAKWRRSPEEGTIEPFGEVVQVPPGTCHGFRTNLATGACRQGDPIVAWW